MQYQAFWDYGFVEGFREVCKWLLVLDGLLVCWGELDIELFSDVVTSIRD